MADQPQHQRECSMSREEHLQEAADVLSIVTAAATVAGAAGGLGGMYYARKSYLAQQDQEPEAGTQRQVANDPGFGGNADYEPGFRGSIEYDPGFGGVVDYHPGFGGDADYYPGFGEDLEY
jgi:hypothetical protein